MSDAVRAALATIVEGGTLSMDEASSAMGAVMDGEATPAQLAPSWHANELRNLIVFEPASGNQ